MESIRQVSILERVGIEWIIIHFCISPVLTDMQMEVINIFLKKAFVLFTFVFSSWVSGEVIVKMYTLFPANDRHRRRTVSNCDLKLSSWKIRRQEVNIITGRLFMARTIYFTQTILRIIHVTWWWQLSLVFVEVWSKKILSTSLNFLRMESRTQFIQTSYHICQLWFDHLWTNFMPC